MTDGTICMVMHGNELTGTHRSGCDVALAIEKCSPIVEGTRTELGSVTALHTVYNFVVSRACNARRVDHYIPVVRTLSW